MCNVEQGTVGQQSLHYSTLGGHKEGGTSLLRSLLLEGRLETSLRTVMRLRICLLALILMSLQSRADDSVRLDTRSFRGTLKKQYI